MSECGPHPMIRAGFRHLEAHRQLSLSAHSKIIYDRWSYFKFLLPIELLEKRRIKFRINFKQCNGLLQYFGINT